MAIIILMITSSLVVMFNYQHQKSMLIIPHMQPNLKHKILKLGKSPSFFYSFTS